ncbi:MAG: hypothetical protein KatS3mg050_3400 [Litorilinea sp.]|nr:MAG: hypothetical protein KatS3mg050_3400 [Litorilinea sp.]
MRCRLTATALRERTQEYWSKNCSYECYITELLGRELQEASKDPSRLRGVGKPVHTLALTVGESFEPLLQIVCVLRPKRVVLILNSHYGSTPGSDHGEDLKRLMLKLAQVSDMPEEMRPQLQDQDFKLIELERDTPTQVFRALRQAMQDPKAQPPERYTNVVDITGAKKSMVVGAFLYAAHSGLPITYVDFDEYDTQWGKPYGYTCRIGEIANPYEAFHLRDWEQVRRLYESYGFRSARSLLGTPAVNGQPGTGILGAMSLSLDGSTGDPLFNSSEIKKMDRFATILEMYEAWENGDYTAAKSLRDSFNPPLPSEIVPWSIDELGGVWPAVSGAPDTRTAADTLLKAHLALKQGEPQPANSLFAQPAKLLAYVRDELAKIERLITKKEDYRSAYLRAAGLEEFLLKARLCMSWLKGVLSATVEKESPVPSNTLTDSDQSRGFAAIVSHSSADAMRETLRRRQALELRNAKMKVGLDATAPYLGEYWNGRALDFDAFVSGWGNPGFTRLRGEAIHTHLHIPRPIAEAALELVRAAGEEFETNWLEHFHPGTLAGVADKRVEAPSWARLCDACELTFLPPRLRQ